jgi:hypothetical protein
VVFHRGQSTNVRSASGNSFQVRDPFSHNHANIMILRFACLYESQDGFKKASGKDLTPIRGNPALPASAVAEAFWLSRRDVQGSSECFPGSFRKGL